MIKEEWMTIVQNKPLALDTYEMILSGELADFIPDSGQFLHIRIGEGMTHLLRRPISITNVNPEGKRITIIYKMIGEGTKWLKEQQPGHKLHVLGPRGNGFPVEDVKYEKILLVGGGVGVPPLYYLARKLINQHNQVITVLGFQTKKAVFYEKKFAQLGNMLLVTEDGTAGFKGRVTDFLPSFRDEIDRYYTCGPAGMLKAVTKCMDTIPGFLSLEERMGCGIGACFACVCKTSDPHDHKGYRKICKDGPVFSAREVIL
ncbi:dihydroorotate dehydrogenase electron transfer subunit [Salinibacillus kushneri]|uniref:Dihydroorotate dehydrogenase B (NAD(+)), electron transfer subunit n=1 Tax=Salinibacillus kushneri TaxID=237682 RepID=A0A1I0HNC2_9BACI|nr:dihydroorotate dehydrogenase electron transfer subunit [Salinibacillus kushneri]SET84641.1 dihydroorotate dehydrogenase electron transfer subunit [Salinibacillus kushneri]